MRMLAAAAGAALLVLTAGPAMAGDHGGGPGCARCDYPPPPPPPCCHGGQAVYLDGYYADYRGYTGRPVPYGYAETAGPACPSAPFGYVATGFGRDDLRPSWCGYRQDGYDRGGRYGYSRRHESRARESWEVRESYEAYGAWEEGYVVDDDDRWRRDCDCRGDRPPAPYPPPYLPEPPRYEPPRHERPRSHRPRRSHPPRQEYRQEPGERG